MGDPAKEGVFVPIIKLKQPSMICEDQKIYFTNVFIKLKVFLYFMKKVDVQELYRESYVDNNFEREELFESLKTRFNINNALYPGSFVHVTPSFFIPEVVYVDNNRQTKKFFEQKDAIADLISRKRPMIQILLSTSYLLTIPNHLNSRKRVSAF